MMCDVPRGAGLSSSAAVELSAARAMALVEREQRENFANAVAEKYRQTREQAWSSKEKDTKNVSFYFRLSVDHLLYFESPLACWPFENFLGGQTLLAFLPGVDDQLHEPGVVIDWVIEQ